LSSHPLLKILQQQKNISEQQTALEKAKMLPGCNWRIILTVLKEWG
jgi:cobalt-zinc-cadmium resistance protein CzcA